MSTVTLAFPGSLVANCSQEAATLCAGTIARCAAAFRVDELVIYDDAKGTPEGTVSRCAAFLARCVTAKKE